MTQGYLDALAAQARQTLKSLGVRTPRDYAAARLQIESRAADSSMEAIQAIKAFAPSTGWMMQASAVTLWGQAWDETNGHLLAGEFAKGEKSLHVRYARGAWLLITLTEGEGEPVVAHSHRYEAVPSINGQNLPGRSLHYRVYHQSQQGLGLRPFQARFIGIGDN